MWQSIHLQHIISQSLMISIFVMAMMVLIEQLNIKTKGIWSDKIRRSPLLQIVVAALLGIIPGCLGAYGVVSLYAHKVVGFAALVSNMIATSGDEAFVMFSLMPHKAILINFILFLVAIGTGFLLHVVGKHNKIVLRSEKFKHEMHLHVHDSQPATIGGAWYARLQHNCKHMTFVRALLLSGTVLFILAILGDVIEHEHFEVDYLLTSHGGEHTHAMHEQHGGEHQHFPWLKVTYIIVLGAAFISFLFADEHFLEEHLWRHVLKKHFVKMLLWTFGALLLVDILQASYTFQVFLSDNVWWVLVFAVLLGMIPQSGPHLLFVILFFQGGIPFSILLANSIVQDGHGALPLLAESRKRFFALKAINLLVGLVVGAISLCISLV